MIPALDWFALAATGVSSAHGTWSELLLIAASGGVVGMGLSDITSGLTDRFSGGGGEQASTDDDFFGDGGGLDEGFGDDMDGDAFGDMDDWDEEGFDDFGGDDGGLGGDGGGQSNLDPRIEELENEVASISSTMGTVRSENEAIQESVEDIEDNIRKLLDIYEMVTRGVNPFVDEPQGGGGVGGSFGLFDDGGDDDGLDDIDPDVADADPDSFFDDDFDDDGFEDDDFTEDDFADDAVEEDPFAADVLEDDALARDDEATQTEGGGDGKTFDELKSEYQTGDAEWDEVDDSDVALEEAPTDPEHGTETEATTTEPSVEEDDDVVGDAGAVVDEVMEDLTPTPDEADDRDGGDETAGSGAGSSDGKPYLGTLPAGYGAELLVIEWLSYLRDHSSTPEVLRAIKYYETIGWIGSDAADSLQRYLSGLPGQDVTPASSGGTQLTIDHHTNSLHYIGKLGGTDVDVERLEWTGPGRSTGRIERRGQRGIQR